MKSYFFTVRSHSGFYHLIAALLLGLTFSGCSNSPEAIDDYVELTAAPVMEADSMHWYNTEEGRLTSHIYAPRMRTYDRDRVQYDEFPWGIDVQVYNDSGRVVSVIHALYALFQRDEKIWEVRYNVVAVNEKGDTIRTEQLFWDQNQKRIYTPASVRVRTPDATLLGVGFESDERFDEWVFRRPTGVISIWQKEE